MTAGVRSAKARRMLAGPKVGMAASKALVVPSADLWLCRLPTLFGRSRAAALQRFY